jgi:hypothetical protein
MGVFNTQHIFWAATEVKTNSILPKRSLSYYPRFFTKAVPLTPNNSINNFPVLFEPHKTDFVNAGSGTGPFPVSIVNSSIAAAGQHPVGSNYIWDPAVKYPTSNYVQYSDRIYAWWQNVGVHRIGGWNFTNTTANTVLTRTLIAASPNIPAASYSWNAFLDVYKDRLFLSVGNRVYFTETAAPGGYPEIWDIATNFLILPVASIYKTFVFNNILYFFTSNGIWTLQVNGPAESWILKLLTPTISVIHEQGVALNGVTFYYTMNNDIFAYNGLQEYVKISDPIEEYLRTCHAIGVFAFEDGCLICTEQFEPTVADSNVSTIKNTRLFYFNQQVWTEVTIPMPDPNDLTIVVGSAVQIAADISNQRPSTYFTVLQGHSSNLSVVTYFVDREHNMGDDLAPDATYVYDTVRVTPVTWDFTVSFNPNALKEKRIKYGFLDVKSDSADYELDMFANIEGKGFFPLTSLPLQKECPTEDKNYYVQFPVDNFARRLDLRTSGTINWTGPAEIPVVPSPLEIKKMSLIFNTSRTEEKYVGG